MKSVAILLVLQFILLCLVLSELNKTRQVLSRCASADALELSRDEYLTMSEIYSLDAQMRFEKVDEKLSRLLALLGDNRSTYLLPAPDWPIPGTIFPTNGVSWMRNPARQRNVLNLR